MKRLIATISLLVLLSNCTPSYRILTIDYNYIPEKYHKYEIVNIKTGEIDTIYDFTFYTPGTYIDLKDDYRVPGSVVKSIIE
jgi:hypothetical protein